MASIKDIAKLAGLSISTVSKVINGKSDDLSQDTIDRVLKIVKEHNYVPYGNVKVKKGTKSFNIALVIKNLKKSFMIVSEMTNKLRECGYTLLLFDSNDSLENENSNLSKLLSKHVDGIVWEPVDLTESGYYARLTKQNSIKILLINTTVENKTNFSIDFELMAYKATEELVKNQHEKISCVYKSNSLRGISTRKGYRRCLMDHQLSFLNEIVFNENSVEIDERELKDSTGIITSHFSAANAIIYALKTGNMLVPEDISLVSLSTDSRNIIENFNISTLNVPNAEFGRFIADKIIDYCEHDHLNLDTFDYEYRLSNAKTIGLPKNKKQAGIVVVGSINVDNMIFLDSFPHPGSVQFSNHNLIIAGGKALNQTIGLKKLNKNVSLIGKIGYDHFGDLVLKTLEKYGVNSNYLTVDRRSKTGIAYITIGPKGESAIMLSPGGNQSFSEKDVVSHESVFEGNLYCVLQTEIPIETVRAAAKLAKKHHLKTILKPAAIKSLEDEDYRLVDIFVPNFMEATLLSGFNNRDSQADFFLNKGVKTVIITLGKEGAYLASDKGERELIGTIDVNPVDETGASDAFISALCAKLVDGFSLKESIVAANLAASFCISNFGVSNSLIDSETLENYLKMYS